MKTSIEIKKFPRAIASAVTLIIDVSGRSDRAGITAYPKFMLTKKPVKTARLLAAKAISWIGFALIMGGTTYSAQFRGEDRGNGNSAAESVAALNINTTGANNTATGWYSLTANTTGFTNTANGFQASFSNTTGSENTAEGAYALHSNTTASGSTATGLNALYFNNGGENTATGKSSMYHNTTGGYNSASGSESLWSNTSGTQNTGIGWQALFSNTTGFENTAVGYQALRSVHTAGGNTAIGSGALQYGGDGNDNTATGHFAMHDATGAYSAADGAYALQYNSGTLNTAVGYGAMMLNTGGTGNTGVGDGALQNNTTGNYNVGLGNGAGIYLTTGSYNIHISNYGSAGESNTIRIGTQGDQTATFIAGITGTAVAGDTVVVDANGQLGVLVSSERFKDNITPMNKASEAIYSLKPVTFRYKCDIDPKDIPQFGLIAEQVAKVNSGLVSRDRDGKPYTVRYEAVNAMLLNEFLKEHRQVQEQQKQIERLTARLEEQAEQIRKVNDKLKMNRPAPQMAVNDR